jgi:hypothetical protein
VSALSEVALLISQRAGDLEKARDIFTSDTRNYVTSILSALHRARSEPWVQARVRIDLPREIDYEAKSGGPLSSQYAVGGCDLRFKRGMKFTVVGRINFGVEFRHESRRLGPRPEGRDLALLRRQQTSSSLAALMPQL